MYNILYSVLDRNIDFYYLERHRRSSAWERHILYPLCFFSLLALTLFSLILVFFNVLSLMLLSEHSPKGAQVCMHIMIQYMYVVHVHVHVHVQCMYVYFVFYSHSIIGAHI